jgi:hypothetical protein
LAYPCSATSRSTNVAGHALLRLGAPRKNEGEETKMKKGRSVLVRNASLFGAQQVAWARAATGLGLTGVGALAVGAAAGALAIGALAIGKLAVKKGKVGRLRIDELEVGRLRVEELIVERREERA